MANRLGTTLITAVLIFVLERTKEARVAQIMVENKQRRKVKW